MKKLLAFVLTLMLIVSAVPLGAFELDVSAEKTTEGYYNRVKRYGYYNKCC